MCVRNMYVCVCETYIPHKHTHICTQHMYAHTHMHTHARTHMYVQTQYHVFVHVRMYSQTFIVKNMTIAHTYAHRDNALRTAHPYWPYIYLQPSCEPPYIIRCGAIIPPAWVRTGRVNLLEPCILLNVARYAQCIHYVYGNAVKLLLYVCMSRVTICSQTHVHKHMVCNQTVTD